MQRDVADETIGMTVEGDGPPLVLFHSLLADSGSFAAIVKPLARRFTVVVADLPGFGATVPVLGGLADVADRMATQVRQTLLRQTFRPETVAKTRPEDETEAPAAPKPIVLGNGFGGFVALQMAIRHPDLAARLVLADCGAVFSEPGRAAFRGMAAAAAAHGLEAIADTAMRRLFAPAFQAEHPALMAERRAAFLRTDPGTFQRACSALATLDLRDAVGQVGIPVLVLVGEEDEATPVPMSEELASLLPDARLTILPGCAHVPQLQQPDAFLAAVDGFLTP